MLHLTVSLLILAVVAGCARLYWQWRRRIDDRDRPLVPVAVAIPDRLAGRTPGVGSGAADMRDADVPDRERFAPQGDGHVRQQMVNVREAFRLRRLARRQRYLHGIYDEHNMFAEARGTRREMMQLLRAARSVWRRTLGIAP